MLTKLDCLLISLILEECMQKLKILNRLSVPEDIKISKPKSKNQVREQKKKENFSKSIIDWLDDSRGAELKDLKAFEKVEKERIILLEMLKNMVRELEAKRDFMCLVEVTQAEKQKNDEISNIESRTEYLKERINVLKTSIQKLKDETDTEIELLEDEENEAKSMIHLVKSQSQIQKNYMVKEIACDAMQTKHNWAEQEVLIQREFENLKNQLDCENRVHAEMASYLSVYNTELEEKISKIKEKFKIDISEKEKTIEEIKGKRSKLAVQMEKQEKLCNVYEDVIREDEESREKERQRLEQLERERTACIAIQKWWRSVLISKFLDRFGDQKSKKKGGSKGKKETGKKKK